jgi:hypothetical protein
LVHGFHNSIVILSPVLRETQAPSLSTDVVFYIVTAVVIVGGILALRKRRRLTGVRLVKRRIQIFVL